jgi:hypothetical protein
MRLMKTILALIVLLTLGHSAQAQVKAGTAGAQFLELSASARGLAMADALLPLADDVSALYYNPAGMTQLDGLYASFSHYDLWVDVTQEWIGVVKADKEAGTAIGFSLTYLNSGMMDETTPGSPGGTGRQFDYKDLAVGLSYAKKLTNKFSAGLSLKFINESTMEVDARGWAADVGTFYETGWRSLKMSMIISNFGPDMKFIDKPYTLPILFKFGVGMDLMGQKGDEHFMQGAFEFGHPSDNVEQMNVGLEYAYMSQFFLRLGKKVNGIDELDWDDYDPEAGYEYPLLSSDGLSFGAGFNFETRSFGTLQFDYAHALSQSLGSRNMITLSWTR